MSQFCKQSSSIDLDSGEANPKKEFLSSVITLF